MSSLPRLSLPALAATVIALVGVPAEAWARRVGFANVAADGAAGQQAIEGARAELVKALGPDEIAAGPGRDALEAPIAADEDEEAAGFRRASALIADAATAFKDLEYDAAFDRLRLADAALRGLSPTPEVVAAMAETNLLLGQVQLARKDEARALEAFRLARRLAPGVTALDPGKYRPQVVELWDRAGKPAGEGTGSVRVTTEPPGATVWLDGVAMGTTPMELGELAPGDHYIGATLAGHAARTERLAIRGGKAHEQTFLLARLPAEKRARALRLELKRDAPGTDWKRAAAALADVASVDLLVLVREAQGGAAEAAIYDVRSNVLGPWVSLAGGVAALVKTAPKPDRGPIAVPPPAEVAKQVPGGGGRGGDGSGRDRGPEKPKRWYRTWWGTGLIIGGGVILVGAVVILTSPEGASEPPSYTIDPGWSDEPPMPAVLRW